MNHGFRVPQRWLVLLTNTPKLERRADVYAKCAGTSGGSWPPVCTADHHGYETELRRLPRFPEAVIYAAPTSKSEIATPGQRYAALGPAWRNQRQIRLDCNGSDRRGARPLRLAATKRRAMFHPRRTGTLISNSLPRQ